MSTPTPITTFGDVTVVSKRLSGTELTVAVRLQQECTTVYPPGSRPHFALQGALAPATEIERTITSYRKATQRFSPEEAASLKEGDVVGGHLRTTYTEHPRYAGQKSAYEGGYASSEWRPTLEPDIDLRHPQQTLEALNTQGLASSEQAVPLERAAR